MSHPTPRPEPRFESTASDGTLKFSLRELLTDGSSLGSLWKAGELCDVVLESEDGFRVRCHKVVLASVSPFFRALFTGAGSAMAESLRRLDTGESVVTLHGILGDGLECVVSAIYTNTIEISGTTLETVLQTSNQLEIVAIRDVCCEYLRWVLGAENCLTLLEISEAYQCYELRDDVMKFVCSRFSELLLSHQWRATVGCLSKQNLLQIIQSQDITVDSERQILAFGLEWIRAEPAVRREDTAEIVSRVQLPAAMVEEELTAAGFDAEAVLRGVASRREPVVSSSDVRQRTPTHILVAGGHDASWRTFKTVELYNPVRDSWDSAASMPNAFSLAGAASLYRRVFVVGGSLFDANVCQYDKHTRQWKRAAPLKTSRIHPAVASVGSAVYVCGGRTGFMGSLTSTEILSLAREHEWVEGPSMCDARCSFGAAALNGDLYVVGGQSARHIYDTVEVLPRGDEKWTLLGASRLQTPRKYLSLCSLAGRLYVLGGMNEHRVRLSSVEALDPREGKWHYVKQMRVQRSSCGAAPLQEKLYALGGNAGDDRTHDTMECYIPEADDWLPCAPLLSARSGLAAVAI